MRRFGWSANKFADEFGFHPERVKKWLQRNPDAAFDAEMAGQGRVGKDGKVYSAVPEADDDETTPKPKVKQIRQHPKPGAAVVNEINRHTAELTNPSWPIWILDKHRRG